MLQSLAESYSFSSGSPSPVAIQPTFRRAWLAAAAATWTSLRLLPPRPSHPSLVALATYAVRFLGQSIVAGVDVAWRALDPRLPLNPGFVAYRPRLSAGSGRRAFCTVASLQPGTLPVGSDQDGTLLIHCLDVDQPVVKQLSEDEDSLHARFGRGAG